MYHYVTQMMWPMGGMGGLILFGVFLIVMGFLYWRNRQKDNEKRRYWEKMDPLSHARIGVARGEISLEEFEEVKKTIRAREDRNQYLDS